jgi:hypothetical protein
MEISRQPRFISRRYRGAFSLRALAQAGWTPIAKQTFRVANISSAILVGFFGVAIALTTLRRGVWLDEFITVAWTTPDTTIREFFRLMIERDFHPILYYGLIYLLQALGETDIAQLRLVNLLGLPLVIFAIAYGYRQKSISPSQALVIWVLFASAPIFFEYFAELRGYFLLYAGSIAISIVWYVLNRRIEANQGPPPATMIATWAVCLAVFVNLHYFATMLGGMLTAVLLAQLAVRRMWPQVLMIACVSLAAAAPALVLGVLQVFSTPKGLMSWIKTSPTESVKLVLRMIENAAAWNLAAVAGAVVTCLFMLEDRKKWNEHRTALILLGIVGMFLGALVIVNAFSPLVVDRYLFAAAGAVTVAVGLLAASSGAPLWLPTAASVIALLFQAQIYRSNLGIDQRGWLPSASAVAQLKSECPTAKIFAYVTYPRTRELSDVALGLKINAVSYGYYAKIFHFEFENLLPGSTVTASGPCPSIIWLEHMYSVLVPTPDPNAEQILSKFQINKIGLAELKRYGWGMLIIVRDESVLTRN